MSSLRSAAIRLAHDNPGAVRDAILPILAATQKTATKWQWWTGPVGVREVAKALESVSGVDKVLAGTEHVYFECDEDDFTDLVWNYEFPKSVKSLLTHDGLKKVSR